MASQERARFGPEPSTAAYRRLLSAAEGSEQAKVDALMGLARRTVFAATWPAAEEAVRTLTNSDGETAMPLFTGQDTLERAARRFGWAGPDGSLPWRELGAREALRTAIEQAVHYVVVDIGTDHVIEFARDEIESVLAAQLIGNGDSDSARATAAVRQAVRHSSRPLRAHRDYVSTPPPQKPVADPLAPPRRRSERPPAASPSAPDKVPPTALRARPLAAPPAPALHELQTAPTAPSLALGFGGPELEPNPAALEAAALVTQLAKQTGDAEALKAAGEVAEMLKSSARGEDAEREMNAAAQRMRTLLTGEAAEQATQPDTAADRQAFARAEVAPREPGELRPLHTPVAEELLAAVAEALRRYPEVEWACELSDGGELPVIAVRVDPSFLARTAEIEEAVVGAAEQAVSVLLLTDPATMRKARTHGNLFFPWRKKR